MPKAEFRQSSNLGPLSLQQWTHQILIAAYSIPSSRNCLNTLLAVSMASRMRGTPM